MNEPSFSIVIETENLGMAGIDDLRACLDSLQAQPALARARESILVAGGQVSASALQGLRRDYPWLTVQVQAEPLEYTRAKAKGARAASSDVIIFADADVRYEARWLDNLLAVFADIPAADVVGGDTRVEIVSSYSLALNLMWMVRIVDPLTRPEPTNDFSLNNMAVRRRLLDEIPFPSDLPLYRSKIRYWQARLQAQGYRIYRAPGTRAYHAAPGSLSDWWHRMLIQGHDFVKRADFSMDGDGEIVERPSRARRLRAVAALAAELGMRFLARGRRLLREDPRVVRYLPLAVPLALVSTGVTLLGGFVTVVDRHVLLERILAREAGHVV